MQRLAAFIFSRLPVFAAIAFLVTVLGVNTHTKGSLTQAFRGFRVESTTPDFADTHTVTNSIDCLLQGQDPYKVRSFDPWNRVYNYPPLWLDLRYLGVTSRTSDLMAITMTVMFVGALLLLFRTKTWIGAAIVFLCLLSRPVLFAIERGNTDLAIFALMVFGFFLIERQRHEVRTFFKGLLVVVLVVLKLFPVAAVAVFVRNRRGLAISLGVAVLSLTAFVLTSGRRVPMILANTPQDTFFSYGAYPFLMALGKDISPSLAASVDLHHVIASVAALILACLAVVVGMRYQEGLNNVLPQLDFDSALGCIAISGLAIYCFTFARGSSYEYRLIFLLGPLAYLVKHLGKESLARMLPAVGILTIFFLVRSETHRMLSEAFDAVVFIGACAWLGTTLLTRLQDTGDAEDSSLATARHYSAERGVA